jgi:hypothetical protein
MNPLVVIALTSLAFAVIEWSIAHIAIAIIVIAAIVGVVVIMLRVFQVSIPPWVIQIFWICLAAAIGVAAVLFLASLFV